MNTVVHVFMLSLSIVPEHCDEVTENIVPFGIVTHAFTLLWDNLS